MLRVQTAIIILLAVLVLVLALALIGSKAKNARMAAAVPPPSPPPPGLGVEASKLVAAGKPIHAIKLVREQTGWSLAAAKNYVDRLGGDVPADAADLLGRDDFDDDELDQQVRDLLAQNKKILAVKLVREATGWGLKDSKDYVDQRRR